MLPGPLNFPPGNSAGDTFTRFDACRRGSAGRTTGFAAGVRDFAADCGAVDLLIRVFGQMSGRLHTVSCDTRPDLRLGHVQFAFDAPQDFVVYAAFVAKANGGRTLYP